MSNRQIVDVFAIHGETPHPREKMFVGVMRLGIVIPGARSLKDRRRVVLSFKERVKARLHVSIAEVGSLDHPRHATFGIAVVSNDAAVCDSVLADRATEIVPFGEGGTGVRGGIETMLDLGPPSSGADDEDEER